MPHKKKHNRRVPLANRPLGGPSKASGQGTPAGQAPAGAPFQEQDPKRRLGDYSGAGEHPFQQPGGRNDANH